MVIDFILNEGRAQKKEKKKLKTLASRILITQLSCKNHNK